MPLSQFSKAFFSSALQEFSHLSAPLFAASGNPVALYRFLHQMGWDFDTVFGVDTVQLLQDFQLAEQTAKSIFLALDHEDDLAIVQDAHGRFKVFIERLENLYPTLMDIDVAGTLDDISLEHAAEFGKDLAHHLLLIYLYKRVPLAFQLGKLFGLIIIRPARVLYPGDDATQKPIRYPLERPTINWQILLSPHTNPFAALIYQINFSAINSLESLLKEVQALFQKTLEELYKHIGQRGLDGMTIQLDATGLSLLGGNWLPFPEEGDPAINIHLSEPGAPQLNIDQQAWKFSWLPDIARPDGSVVIFEQDWIKITLLPALESEDQFTNPGLYLYENDSRALTFETVGGMGIEFPLDMLVDEAGNSVSGGARGRLVLSAGSTPRLTIDEIAIGGNFRFGGPDGLAIEEAQLAIQNIELPLTNPGSFPFSILLSGTLVLADSAGSISVTLAFDREQVYFKSTAEVHLGNGIWLRPIDEDTAVLEMSASSEGSFSFSVAAMFQVPQEGAGLAEVEVSGQLDLERNALGAWQVINFSAASVVDNLDWELPGQILLKNAGVWLSYDSAIPSFNAGINGGFSLSESEASINLDLEFSFPNLEDPTDIEIQAKLDIAQLLLLDQVYFFNLDIELFVWTKTDGGALAPSGYLEVLEASLGLFPKDSIVTSPSPEQFHLVIKEVQSLLRFQSNGFEFELTDGDLLLPPAFYDNTNNAEERASISIGEHPISLVFENGTGLSFEGSLIVAQIGLVTEAFSSDPKPGVYLDSAQLLLPNIEIPSSGPVSVDLPQLTDAFGQVVIPVSTSETLEFAFAHFSWDILGIPQGIIYLDGNTDIQLGGGFFLSFIGETPPGTGLSLFQGSSGPEIEIMATVRLTMPASMLTSVDGDTLAIEAGGRLSLYPGLDKIEFSDLNLAFIGNFHLGGSDGFFIKDGRIEAVAIENMLSPTPAEPFEILLSGTLTLPNGPKGGLENARFIFTGDPLPKFDLDGIVGGTGDMNLAGDYLPLNVKELRLSFDPDKELPDKLYPMYTTVNADAELNIGEVLSGAVEDLTITFDENGTPSFSVDSIMMLVDGLEMGSFVLGGGLGIGGLNDIPDSLVVAGNLKGKFNGTGIEALAAFGMIDGIPAPLGAALGVQLGPGGIPLWATGFLLTGAKGGISFTGGNADPDDLKNYIIIDESTGSIDSQPRPEPEAVADVDPEQQEETRRAPSAPEGEILEFQCPDEPCPPPSVGILYEPHPDSENYPHRIIIKFSSLQKSVVDELLDYVGIPPTQLEAMTPEAIGTQLSQGIVEIFSATLPFLTGQIETLIRQPMKELFQAAVERALANSDNVYEVILREAYKGLRAPNVTVKLTGIVSYTGISSFLAVEGGVVISPTVQSAGIVGNVLLLGIPVGRLRAFLTLNNELGMIDPALCGDLAFSLGPLDLGYLRLTYKYGVDFANLGSTLIDLISGLNSSMIELAMAQVDLELFETYARNPVLTLQAMGTEQLLAFIAQIMQQSFSPEVRNFLLGLFDAMWDNFNPEMLLCGSAQPKIFGLALDGELVGISAMVDKSSFAANFRFSPTGVLSKGFYNILPAIDQMSCSIRTELPDPRPLIEAGLSANLGRDGMAGFLQDGILHVINNTQATLDYEIAPLGLKLANAEARILLPYLQAHPAHPDSNWKRPEDRPGSNPSRIEVLMAALDDDKLGNIFWKGTNAELNALPGLSGIPLGNLELHKDYFPHGGILGSGRLMLPKILLDSPPIELFNQLFVGSVFQKAQVAMQLINEYLLTTRSVGQLAFFIPAPNPPVGALEQAQDLAQLLEQVRKNDFDLNNFDVPELYPKRELFLKGFLGTSADPLTILGVPLGYSTIELLPPENGAEGYFKIESAIPTGSWLQSFVENATLHFTIRKRPSKAIAERFGTLRDQLQRARNKTAVINNLIEDLNDEMPKVSLLVNINNLQVPSQLSPIISSKGQITANLAAYSHLYDYKANFNKTGLLAKAKNEGGLVLTLSGNLRIAEHFHLTLKSVKTEIAFFPELIGFPGMAANFMAKSIGLPAGLPSIKNAEVKFQTEGAGTVPILPSGGFSIKGSLQNNSLKLELQQEGSEFKLEGMAQLNYKIKGKVGPLYAPSSGIKLLDSISINSNYTGNFYFSFRPTNGQILISKSKFNWNGQEWLIPDFSVIIGDSRIFWPSRILAEIKNQAYEIFSKLLSDPDAWFEALQTGAFELANQTVANIAAVLKALKANLAKAAKLLAKKFSDVAGVIKALFEQFGGNMLEILKVLKAAGFKNSQAIADAIFALYSGAYLEDLVNLFQNHWTSWSNPIRSIMSRLISAGFGLEAVMEALKNAFGSSKLVEITNAAKTYWGSSLSKMKDIASALKKLWGSNYTNMKKTANAISLAWDKSATIRSNIAKSLKYAWGASIGQMNNIAKALKYAWGSGTGILNNVAQALKAAWGSNYFMDIAKALKLGWAGTSDLIGHIAYVLKNYFTLSHNAILSALKHCGFDSYKVAAEMKVSFNASAFTVAKFLKDSWNKTATDIAKRLRDADYLPKYIAEALKDLGYSIYTVATIFKNHFSLLYETIMSALKYAGYGSYELAAKMKSVFGVSATTVAVFLKDHWSKNSTDITRRLRDAGYTSKYVANALENIGYSAYTVAKRLKEEFSGLSHNSAMKALKYAGYSSKEVTKEMFRVFKASATTVAIFLKEEWNKGYGSIKDIMTEAGFGLSSVIAVLSTLFN